MEPSSRLNAQFKVVEIVRAPVVVGVGGVEVDAGCSWTTSTA